MQSNRKGLALVTAILVALGIAGGFYLGRNARIDSPIQGQHGAHTAPERPVEERREGLPPRVERNESPLEHARPQSSPKSDPYRDLFFNSAPRDHSFVGADTSEEARRMCKKRGGRIVPDMSAPLELTENGYRRPNTCKSKGRRGRK